MDGKALELTMLRAGESYTNYAACWFICFYKAMHACGAFADTAGDGLRPQFAAVINR
jgi:hypothetical protein